MKVGEEAELGSLEDGLFVVERENGNHFFFKQPLQLTLLNKNKNYQFTITKT